MNLNTITEVKRPTSPEQVGEWADGHAWLGGGTWLFSEPQLHTDTLIDLERFGWPALIARDDGLEIAATCRIAELYAFEPPAAWRAGSLLRECCNAFLASFKIWNAATVGGNLCMSLPAGPMVSLTAALEGTLTLWPRRGPPRQVPVVDFVTGNHANLLQRGELIRSVTLPASALRKRFAFRHASLTHFGRSSALLMATVDDAGGDWRFTITAATPRPVVLRFARAPGAAELRETLDRTLPADGYFGDVHGTAAYKQHLTRHFTEELRAELAANGARS
jgi:CO/xanthine dehydrogenase FAD-binding subunit